MVPEGWRQTILTELAEVITKGTTPTTGELGGYSDSGVRFLRVENIGENAELELDSMKFISAETHRRMGRSQLHDGDLLFTIAGALGRAALVPAKALPANINQAVAVIRLLQDAAVDSRFILYSLRSPLIQSHIDGTGAGNAQKNLNLQQVGALPVPLPPLPEQRTIAAILTAVDDAIQATQAVIDQTRVVMNGCMADLFTGRAAEGGGEGTPLGTWAVGRLPGAAVIPKGWRHVLLGDVARLESEHTPSRMEPSYWDGAVQWLSLHDTKQMQQRSVLATTMTITEEGLTNSSARLLPKGTVAFSRTASVGHCVLLGQEMATSQDFANYVPGPELYGPWLMHLFRWMAPLWATLSSGSTHKTIYMPVFKKLKILLPPRHEQERMAAIADSFLDEIEAENRKKGALVAMKQGLMHDLLTGTVRAPGVAA